ncbi:MAG: hypothetical protein Q3961_03810, partial [Bifidobacteriaceae bacterium]|nr:hypothetical protein [Bifidobacteriaceae bacterium]
MTDITKQNFAIKHLHSLKDDLLVQNMVNMLPANYEVIVFNDEKSLQDYSKKFCKSRLDYGAAKADYDWVSHAYQSWRFGLEHVGRGLTANDVVALSVGMRYSMAI